MNKRKIERTLRSIILAIIIASVMSFVMPPHVLAEADQATIKAGSSTTQAEPIDITVFWREG